MKSILIIFSLMVLLALAYSSIESDVFLFANAPNSTVKDVAIEKNQDNELTWSAKNVVTNCASKTPRLIAITPEVIERANQIYDNSMKQRELANFAHVLTKDGPEAELDSTSNPVEFSRLTAENQRLYDAIQASTSN